MMIMIKNIINMCHIICIYIYIHIELYRFIFTIHILYGID